MRDEKKEKELQPISRVSSLVQEGGERRRNVLPVLKTAVRNVKSMPADQSFSKWRSAENVKSVNFPNSDSGRDVSGGSCRRKDGEELMLQRAMGEMKIGRLKKPMLQVKVLYEI